MTPARILALTKYGDRAASTRQRFLQYLPILRDQGFDVTVRPLLSSQHVANLALGRRSDALSILGAYWQRLSDLLSAREFDLIWLHCESFPYLPGVFERLVFGAGRPVIYDADDAIFHQYDMHEQPLVRAMLGNKLRPLLSGVAAAVCGNQYIAGYAADSCGQVHVVPTVVDTDVYVPKREVVDGPIVVGWIGSPSTWHQLRPIVPSLLGLRERYNIRIRVIGAGPVAAEFPGVEFVEWSEAGEIEEIQAMDIGVMPLPDQPWARGKCGYKLIQYMACGLPIVASPVGMNIDLIAGESTGLRADTVDDWANAVATLIEKPGLRATMGRAGRSLVESRYSLASQAPRLTEIFRDTLKRCAA